MKKMKRKKLKGMTLLEIIVALAIFAMLASLLILAGTTSDKLLKSTNGLKTKMTEQSPNASVQKKTYIDGSGVEADLDSESVTISVGIGSDTIDIEGNKFSTEKITKPEGMTAEEEAAYYDKANANLNFQFVEVIEPTTAPTT